MIFGNFVADLSNFGMDHVSIPLSAHWSTKQSILAKILFTTKQTTLLPRGYTITDSLSFHSTCYFYLVSISIFSRISGKIRVLKIMLWGKIACNALNRKKKEAGD